jgi:hexosaminidase
MYRRLAPVSTWLETQGMQHRTQLAFMLKRLAGSHPVAPLADFASILEPVKGYVRHESQPYKSLGGTMLMNRLVDSIPPESDVARDFNAAVDRFLATHSTADDQLVRRQLTASRDNVPRLLPILTSEKLLLEHLKVAADVLDLCKAGLEALDAFRDGTKMSANRPVYLERIAELANGRADVLIQIAPGVLKLIEAAPH